METETKRRGPIMAEYLSPGPLAYALKTTVGAKSHTITKPLAPSFSLGMRTEDKLDDLPGPGYAFDANITSRGRSSAPSFSLASRHFLKPVEKTPGAGSYNSHAVPQGVLSGDTRARLISMGQRTKDPFHNDAPPPNAYAIKSGIGSRAVTEKITPCWSMSGRHKFGSAYYTMMKSENPGPGAYGWTDPTVNKPASGKFSLGGRTERKDYNTVKYNPGPGSYDVRRELSPGKGCKMGIRHSVYTMPLIRDVDLI